MEKYNIAIVGATGAVGSEVLDVLSESDIPIDTVHAVASERSKNKQVSFGDKSILVVKDINSFDFKGIDMAIFTAGSAVSEKYAPIAAKQGCIVIDNTSFFRMQDNVPLIIPEINPDAIDNHQNIIANPNCATIQMLIPLKPLHDIAKIKRIVVSTYQSVSGAGSKAMSELYRNTKKIFEGHVLEQQTDKKKDDDSKHNSDDESKHNSDIFPKPIAFNCIPQIDIFMEDDYTREEWKMSLETQKIMGTDIKVTATCVRVPVFIGHAEAVNVEFEKEISIEEISELLYETPNVMLLDINGVYGYATHEDARVIDEVMVSRIRKDCTVKHGINMWIVANNLRKGAAINSVQILKLLIEKDLV